MPRTSGSSVKSLASLHSMTTSGMPFTNSTMSGMMKSLTAPGVSMRNWLMARKWFRSGWSKSISLTFGILLAGQFVDIDLGAVEQFLDGFVGFDQAAAGLAEQFVVQVVRVACR